MDGLGRAIGDGITSLVATALDVIGDTVRAIYGALERSLPGGWLFVVAFVGLAGAAWVLAKR